MKDTNSSIFPGISEVQTKIGVFRIVRKTWSLVRLDVWT